MNVRVAKNKIYFQRKMSVYFILLSYVVAACAATATHERWWTVRVAHPPHINIYYWLIDDDNNAKKYLLYISTVYTFGVFEKKWILYATRARDRKSYPGDASKLALCIHRYREDIRPFIIRAGRHIIIIIICVFLCARWIKCCFDHFVCVSLHWNIENPDSIFALTGTYFGNYFYCGSSQYIWSTQMI